MALSSKATRHRSSSDPFSDPTTYSYSSYGVPTLSRNAPQSHRLPPPPPKPPKTAPSRYQQSSMATRDIPADAVKDVVTVRRIDQNQSPRTRVGRSQTQAPPPASSSRPAAGPPRRSLSQDSAARVTHGADKAKSPARRPTPKKGSSHADVIDRLDFSGVGPMFHHDGPFDACAPSRNRHKTKAPMYAWSSENPEDRNALANAREFPTNTSSSPYPSPGIYVPYEAPKKKRDAIAEAWGIHEPEPFEDFSAGGGYSQYTERESNTPTPRNGTRTRKDAREARDKYREYLEEGQTARRQQTKRALPPPQPIFVPESEMDAGVINSAPLPSSPGAPKRSRSIMNRIRKMRDAPNVPVGYDEFAQPGERDPSPTSSAENSAATHSTSHGAAPTRPTHRAQNSFLGRLGRPANGASKEGTSPTSDNSDNFVYVETGRKDKSLPATPAAPRGGHNPAEEGGGYFDSAGGTGYVTSPGGGGLGRKTSLLKKMKGVVKGAK
ncbi:hypothetical protein K474DRAFT_1586070 [Panus rudis PR-1116 ss-1]|nr:hypothetical protein K474DRAFT_1586070 [Panus rudis PR-1116 ss-1]